MIILNNYTPMQLDLLKELVNIGGGNAATSISQLIDKPVNMTVPVVDILEYDQVYEKIMAEDEMVNAVIMRMLGDAEGVFLFIATDEILDNLVEMMLPEGIEANEEIRESVLKELVNILVNSYLNSISKIIDVNLLSSVPVMAVDMFGAVLSSLYIQLGQYDEHIMILKSEFLYLGDKLESSLYFIPRPGVLDDLFKIIGV